MHDRVRAGLDGRAVLLVVPAAAMAVHQLRYSLAYGSQASAELTAQGHSYLHSLVPWMILGIGAALSSFLRRAARAARTGEAGSFARLSAPVLWALTSGLLVVVYAMQEGLEELFSAGHPTGATGIVGNGGWWAVPASAAVAVLVVALLRLGRAVLRLAARRAPRGLVARPRSLRLPLAPALAVAAPLASAAAGRAPPVA
jgi:hypothetical protein